MKHERTIAYEKRIKREKIKQTIWVLILLGIFIYLTGLLVTDALERDSENFVRQQNFYANQYK